MRRYVQEGRVSLENGYNTVDIGSQDMQRVGYIQDFGIVRVVFVCIYKRMGIAREREWCVSWRRNEKFYSPHVYTRLSCPWVIWGVSRQLPQRAAREPQIVLFLTHVYDTKIYLKKLFDKRFRRIFSSAFQWYRQFFRNFPFSPSKRTKSVISQKVYF